MTSLSDPFTIRTLQSASGQLFGPKSSLPRTESLTIMKREEVAP
jgi:hypothetical protein